MNKIAVLFSGGIDSSLVACIAADQAEEVHLITCITQCIIAPDNMDDRIKVLKKKFPKVKFIHKIISAEKVLKRMWNSFFVEDLIRYGSYRTYPCANCKLSMHIRGIAYCLDNSINKVFCGANVMMSFNPEQNYKGIKILKEFYKRYGIDYDAPVFWYENVDIMLLNRYDSFKNDPVIVKNLIRGISTSDVAKKYGIGKGDMKLNVKNQYSSQPLCKQSTYSTYYLQYYFLPKNGFERLEQMMHSRMRFQLNKMGKELDKYRIAKKSKMFCE